MGDHRQGRAPRRAARWVAACLGTALVATALAQLGAGPAGADTAESDPNLPATVSADALPTVQINGVVWDQVVVGNRVYATGSFTTARPAGAAPGTNEVARSNILAFDIRTGALITTWAPSLNAQGLVIEASADGTRIFVGGEFTSVSGQARSRLVALDATTGAVVGGFTPAFSGPVSALEVVGNTLYAGGTFLTVNNQARLRLAAVDATTGALLAWAPTVDRGITAMIAHTASNRLIIGGSFATLNGVAQTGTGSVDLTTGEIRPWAANQTIINNGDNTSISDLTTDGETIFGSAWAYFGAGGTVANFEGQFAADPVTGQLKWINGCRGDQYGVEVIGEVLYAAGHSHDCGMVGGNPQLTPSEYQRGQAIHKRVSPYGRTNVAGPSNNWRAFVGMPAAEMLHWLPTIALGTYTGQYQGPWTVEGNSDYVVMGGEFPRVNGIAQQGLVRFARRGLAPNTDPVQGVTELAPRIAATGPGTVRIGWTGAWDRDNARLTYQVLRGAQTATATVLSTEVRGSSNWWTRPPMAFTDRTAPPGSQQTYRIRVTDPLGNTIVSSPVVATVPTGTPGDGAYSQAVSADQPMRRWRMGEANGPAVDRAGSEDLVLQPTIGRNVTGAIAGDPDGAARFPGSADNTVVQAQPTHRLWGPQAFTVEAWVNTTTTTGGQIIGFGDRGTARSRLNYTDRKLYMTNDGRIAFGVRPAAGPQLAVLSAPGLNDGRWHHVVGTLGASGQRLYVDGVQVANAPSVTSAQFNYGYWRVGGDLLEGWPSAPTREAIDAAIDEVAVYPAALNAARVAAHYAAAGAVAPPPPPTNVAPTAAFTASTSNLTARVDGSASSDPDGSVVAWSWNFGDGTTGTGPTATRTYAAAGTYTVTLTVTDDKGATATTTRQVTVTAPPSAVFASDAFGRTVTGGWGTADVGGAWTTTGTATDYAVNGGLGRITAPAPAAGRTALLAGVQRTDTDVSGAFSLGQTLTGNGAYVSLIGRRVGTNNDYRAQLRFAANRAVTLNVTRMVGGVETVLQSVVLPGVTYTPGQVMRLRLRVTGTGTTTVRARAWRDGTTEPTTWTASATDTSAALQAAGSVGVQLYLSGSATVVPMVLSVDDLIAGPTA